MVDEEFIRGGYTLKNWSNPGRPVTYSDSVQKHAHRVCADMAKDNRDALVALTWHGVNIAELTLIAGSLAVNSASDASEYAAEACLILRWYRRAKHRER